MELEVVALPTGRGGRFKFNGECIPKDKTLTLAAIKRAAKTLTTDVALSIEGPTYNNLYSSIYACRPRIPDASTCLEVVQVSNKSGRPPGTTCLSHLLHTIITKFVAALHWRGILMGVNVTDVVPAI